VHSCVQEYQFIQSDQNAVLPLTSELHWCISFIDSSSIVYWKRSKLTSKI